MLVKVMLHEYGTHVVEGCENEVLDELGETENEGDYMALSNGDAHGVI